MPGLESFDSVNGFGIIEIKDWAELLDAVALLRTSGYWSADDDEVCSLSLCLLSFVSAFCLFLSVSPNSVFSLLVSAFGICEIKGLGRVAGRCGAPAHLGVLVRRRR